MTDYTAFVFNRAPMDEQCRCYHGAMPPPNTEDTLAATQSFRDDYAAVREQIARVVVGHDAIVDGVLTCLFTGGHALLEGVPGIGKTLLIRTLGKALSLDFTRIQFTPDLMPADITGTTIVAEREGEGGAIVREFRFQPGPVFTQILLADEINRATPKAQSALLEAMQERSVTVAGVTHALPAPFFVMATQNPLEQEGTYPLPEAQLDRFFFKLNVGYSTRAELNEILARTTSGDQPEAEAVLNAEKVIEHQALIRRVAIAEHVRDYAVRLVLATHPISPFSPKGAAGGNGAPPPIVAQYVRVGASPRAAQTLVLAGKVSALLDGRATVSIDDLRAAALPAIRHRLILNFEGEAQGVTSDTIIENIVATLPVDAS